MIDSSRQQPEFHELDELFNKFIKDRSLYESFYNNLFIVVKSCIDELPSLEYSKKAEVIDIMIWVVNSGSGEDVTNQDLTDKYNALKSFFKASDGTSTSGRDDTVNSISKVRGKRVQKEFPDISHAEAQEKLVAQKKLLNATLSSIRNKKANFQRNSNDDDGGKDKDEFATSSKPSYETHTSKINESVKSSSNSSRKNKRKEKNRMYEV